ncbi:uncharacterized protein LOC135391807 isoform X2 [Ornithodoros turicata]|uniref:uncharacterized protein LOC135391807 isoform X2 n=1 Tax=Ornithodoros turicata TaxID=34597 RepID=UPI003138FF58
MKMCTMASERVVLFLVLFSGHVICEDQEVASVSSHKTERVNINLMEFTKPTVKLGLLGVHKLATEEKERITTDGKVNFNAMYNVTQEIKNKELRAREADIIYVLTKTTILSGGKEAPGAAWVRGACTDNNIAIGNDFLWSYGGFDVFRQNIAALLGGLSLECDSDGSDAFDECRRKHIMSHLKRIWINCYGHTSFSKWVPFYTMSGERIDKNEFCAFKMGNQSAKECSSSKKQNAENSSCEIYCCPAERGANDLADVSAYESPAGTTCRAASTDAEKGSCYGKQCKRRVALLRYAFPGTDNHIPLDWN